MAESRLWGVAAAAAVEVRPLEPDGEGGERADETREQQANDDGDAALLSELRDLEEEWRTEEDYDDAQLFPPGEGSTANLTGNDRQAYAKLIAELFEAGTGVLPGGTGEAALEVRSRELLKQAQRMGEDDPRLPWLGSLVLARLGRHEAALSHLARAGELSPKQQSTLLLQRASLELEQEDPVAALRTCRNMVDQWPSDEGRWPGDEAREILAGWLGQIAGFVAGGESGPTSRLEELRRVITRRWPNSLVETFDRELERVRKSRLESRRRRALSLEQQQAEARQEVSQLESAIERFRDAEKRLQAKLDSLKEPHERQLDAVVDSLKQKSQKLTVIQSQARRLAARLQQASQKKAASGKGNARGKGNSRGKGGSRSKGKADGKGSAREADSQRDELKKQLKTTLDEIRDMQQEVAGGRARRRELEASHAKTLLPVKQEWNRVRLDRQSREKELEQAREILSRPAGSPPVPERFRQWRTVREVDLVKDLQAHWRE